MLVGLDTKCKCRNKIIAKKCCMSVEEANCNKRRRNINQYKLQFTNKYGNNQKLKYQMDWAIYANLEIK